MTWDHASPFIHRVTVLAEHIDALDHTNNTQYVNWCNEAAWAHTTELGLGAEAYNQRVRRRLPDGADGGFSHRGGHGLDLGRFGRTGYGGRGLGCPRGVGQRCGLDRTLPFPRFHAAGGQPQPPVHGR